MAASPSLLVHQGPQIASLLHAGLQSVQRAGQLGDLSAVSTPGPAFTATVRPPPELVHAYLRFLGGDPSSYKRTIPPHLFCWWALPLMGRTLEALPLDPSSVINGGATLTVNAPLPAGTPLVASAQLAAIDQDERRTLVTQRLTTGPADAPEALVVETRLFFRNPKGPKRSGPKAPPVTVPQGARELSSRRLSATAGRDFAVLTGDFNPIHWIAPAGKAAGFGGCILHGYATLGMAWEAWVRVRQSGRADTIGSFDARFSRPVRLPGTVRVFDVGDGVVHAAPAVGAPTALIGRITAA